MKINFTKMHGLGNDFIVVDLTKRAIPDIAGVMTKLSDRRFGIGFDQAIILKKSRKADFKMEIYNADGSEVEMCGNGIRCLAAYIWTRRLSSKKRLKIETLAGIIIPEKDGDMVRVDMGEPVLDAESIPARSTGTIMDRPVTVAGTRFLVTAVSMGNPHCVVFVDNVDGFDITKYGPLLEGHRLFPNRANVEFVEVLSKRRLKMRVWERGAGETLACGTGACATAVAAHMKGLTDRVVTVKLAGGDLQIELNKNDNHVYMTGPAQEVFIGTATIK